MYKLFACMIPGRLEDLMDVSQPEEQHGFRTGRCIEEFFFSPRTFLQTFCAVPVHRRGQDHVQGHTREAKAVHRSQKSKAGKASLDVRAAGRLAAASCARGGGWAEAHRRGDLRAGGR